MNKIQINLLHWLSGYSGCFVCTNHSEHITHTHSHKCSPSPKHSLQDKCENVKIRNSAAMSRLHLVSRAFWSGSKIFLRAVWVAGLLAAESSLTLFLSSTSWWNIDVPCAHPFFKNLSYTIVYKNIICWPAGEIVALINLSICQQIALNKCTNTYLR